MTFYAKTGRPITVENRKIVTDMPLESILLNIDDLVCHKVPFIRRVIFNDPATIIIWIDGSKTVVKAHNEPFDPEKGFAMAVCKKLYGKKQLMRYIEIGKQKMKKEVTE